MEEDLSCFSLLILKVNAKNLLNLTVPYRKSQSKSNLISILFLILNTINKTLIILMILPLKKYKDRVFSHSAQKIHPRSNHKIMRNICHFKKCCLILINQTKTYANLSERLYSLPSRYNCIKTLLSHRYLLTRARK